MKDKKFVEVVDISSNHTIVVGTVGKGKRSDMFKQLLREEENNEIPEPLIGDRVISTDELIHSDRTKYWILNKGVNYGLWLSKRLWRRL